MDPEATEPSAGANLPETIALQTPDDGASITFRRKDPRIQSEKTVIAAVRRSEIEVVIMRDNSHEKITIAEGGACTARRKNVPFTFETEEMEIIHFENI